MYYQKEAKFTVAINGIIFGFKNNELYALIANRVFDPLKGQRSLIGGFVLENENVDEAAGRIIGDYTGLPEIKIEQIGAYGGLIKEFDSRLISVAYYALINLEEFDEKLCKRNGTKWISINSVGDLAFDQNLMLKDALKVIKRKATTSSIGFDLLPEKFTLPKLQTLYEAIYQTPIDKRNFRKRIRQMNILDRLDEKDKSSSKKGAYYYTFNKDVFDNLIETGHSTSFIPR
jgi:hypothetical protein